MTRRDGKVFNLEWKKQVPYKLPKKIGDSCSVCGTPISFKDKITPFNMVKLNKFGEIESYEVFDSIIDASRWSGVSVHALRNACEKGNPKVTRRKGGVQTYWIKWRKKCYKHHHMATNNNSEEVYSKIVEKVGEEKLKERYRKEQGWTLGGRIDDGSLWYFLMRWYIGIRIMFLYYVVTIYRSF